MYVLRHHNKIRDKHGGKNNLKHRLCMYLGMYIGMITKGKLIYNLIPIMHVLRYDN